MDIWWFILKCYSTQLNRMTYGVGRIIWKWTWYMQTKEDNRKVCMIPWWCSSRLRTSCVKYGINRFIAFLFCSDWRIYTPFISQNVHLIFCVYVGFFAGKERKRRFRKCHRMEHKLAENHNLNFVTPFTNKSLYLGLRKQRESFDL